MPILKQYNKLLTRHSQAVAYMDNQKIPIEERVQWVPQYKAIVRELAALLDKIGNYSEYEVLNGFNVKRTV